MNAGKNGYYVSGNYESTRISRLVCLQNDVTIRRAALRNEYSSAAIADSTASEAFRSLSRRLFYHPTEIAADTL